MIEKNYTGTPTIVYQVSKEAMEKAIRDAQASQVDENFLAPFTTTIVCAKTAAEILGVHYNTALDYVKHGILECEPRTHRGDNSHVKFNLAKVLKFRRDRELKKIK